MTAFEKLKAGITELNGKASGFKKSAEKVVDACRKIGKSWSGSSLVRHAKFFFGDFEEPQASQRFSIEWGLINGVPRGWIERSDEEVREYIEKTSKVSLDKTKELAIELENGFVDIQREAVLFLSENGFSEADVEKIEKYTIKSATDIFNSIFPTKFMSRDSEAIMSGTYITPHIYYEAIAQYIVSFPDELKGFLFEVEKIARKQLPAKPTENSDDKKAYYVDSSRILGLSELGSEKYDLSKLIKMCKELNDNYSLGNYLSCGMLLRAILDHVSPIFGKKSFAEVANNYGTKSFKDIVLPLENSARKISDLYLHNQIQKKEILPNKTQVSFQPNLDVLLSEIIRIIQSE